MKVFLLYKDREKAEKEMYYDTVSIVKDLGLKTIFLNAAKRLVYEGKKIKNLETEDPFLMDTLKTVMMTPLATAEEIRYRQEIINDCIFHEELIRSLYETCKNVQLKSDALIREHRDKSTKGNPVTKLISEIRVLHLLQDSLSSIRRLLEEQKERFTSEGLIGFQEAFLKAWPKEREEFVRSALADISFYTCGAEDADQGRNRLVRPRIVLECGLEDGLKFSTMKLEELSSGSTRFVKPGGTLYKIQEYFNSRVQDSFSTTEDERINEQAHQLEYGIVSFVVEELKGELMGFKPFFDKLRYQTAFYLAAVQLVRHFERIRMQWCFPQVSDRRDLKFADLKEPVLGLSRLDDVVGNDCELKQKDLVIITGANQGGKSTFLRSIGIAQVMMQCGLMVAATTYHSGIFPRIFVHFTRREDSQMNSGRLDEELKRMNKIVEQIGEGSLLLLNESFATTTEKEGSGIAYDITKALCEAGVRILTVTHILAFARRVYEENKEEPRSAVEFLTAERNEDGSRTFRMIRHAPEETSFGLDLYDEIVGQEVFLCPLPG
ncbi:MAG: hypothetical protein J6O73_11070 [Lachnospiraceae bacterium]|nr:hypothetical protein [Lachnospiraceae bacterium]